MPTALSSKLDAVKEAADELAEAQERRDQAIKDAAQDSTTRRIAEAAGISHQRVSQIVHS